MKITLSQHEYEYLLNATFLDTAILSILSSKEKNVDLPEEIIEQLREQLEKRLQEIGYDEKYKPTREGILIENLIDRLLII